MSFTRIAALALLAASMSIGSVDAQSLRNAQTPAEFPPASFKGTQYIDSNGCVFIRAGIDGNVTWVPRVNRQRQLICGQSPTLSAEAAATARATPQATAQGTPEQITIDPPAAEATAAPQPTPAPRPTVRTTQIAPTPAPQPTRRVTVQRPAPTAVPSTTPPVAVRRSNVMCPAGTTISPQSLNPDQSGPVRCVRNARTRPATPPVAPIAPPVETAAAPSPVEPAAGPQTRVVPRHVFEQRALKRPSRIPEGFVPVWEDDRLNPRRAEQSLNGIAQTRLAWTNTVPRRLIDRSTGQDVTSRVPLVFPYTDIDTQERDLGTVTLVRRDGQLMKRVQRKTRTKARQPVATTRSTSTPVATAQTRATPKATAPTAVTKGQYVQVGMYGVPSNAQAAAQRILRAGLPARIGKVTRGGKSYQVVLAGPFASSADLSTGLKRSRNAGFSDAFVRK